MDSLHFQNRIAKNHDDADVSACRSKKFGTDLRTGNKSKRKTGNKLNLSYPSAFLPLSCRRARSARAAIVFIPYVASVRELAEENAFLSSENVPMAFELCVKDRPPSVQFRISLDESLHV